MSVSVGSEIAGLRLTTIIGLGGMAIVYLAERLKTGEQVAVKVLRSDLAADASSRRRMLREARYASSLGHSGIVKIYDTGEVKGVPYIAMQYVQGTDLRKRLASGVRLSEVEALHILGQTAEALDAAHAAGLVHRDIKPGNILIEAPVSGSSAPRCFLADFGLSKDPGHDSVALTAAGTYVGSVLYSAPEQILGEPIDGRADVYSLGCVLYECLVGIPPFPGTDMAELIQAHVEAPPPKVSLRRPELPREADAVIARALAKRPEDRYPTCRALLEHARAALAHGAPAPVAPRRSFALDAELDFATGELMLALDRGEGAVRVWRDGGDWSLRRA